MKGVLRALFVCLMALCGPLAVAASAIPEAGSIRFDVHYGAQGFKVGEARHTWRVGPDHYELALTLEARGLAGLFGLEYTQRSAGRIVAEGLRPDRFSVDQRGRKQVSALFDWGASRVSLRRDGVERRSGVIAAGAQDVLSLWHQARLHARSAKPAAFAVVTGKSVKQATLEPMGRETIKLGIGEVETWRLKAHAEGGGLDIDIWLSIAHALLPVRIRITDEDGGVLDQRAAEIDLGKSVPDGTS